MMDLDNYYLHATGGFKGEYNKRNRIIDILQDNKINTKFYQKNYQFSPNKEICLCDPSIKENTEDIALTSSFKSFVLYSPTLVFTKDIDVFTPIFGIDKGMADMYDEVRHKGNLSLEHLEFITFPIWPTHVKVAMSRASRVDDLRIFKENIEVIESNYNIPIRNIYTGKKIDSSDVERTIKYYIKHYNMGWNYDKFR